MTSAVLFSSSNEKIKLDSDYEDFCINKGHEFINVSGEKQDNNHYIILSEPDYMKTNICQIFLSNDQLQKLPAADGKVSLLITTNKEKSFSVA